MLGFLGKFLDSNEREVDKLKNIVTEINNLEKKISKLTDKQLQAKFAEFKQQYEKGKNLDELLPEVYACVRESANRNIKQRHFDVQMMSAIVLHQGKIAEQKTGEGKTLSSTPAIFLNAITGKGVHVVTVNDYLARRDAGWMGPVFHGLGASVATIIHEQAFIYDPKYKDPAKDDKRLQHLRPVSRREAYQADVTYGTNNEFGFDYLRDNMVFKLEDQSQRGHHFAIVDEVDSILIDEARTPLIISQPAAEATEKYYKFSKIIEGLSAADYVVDEKAKTAHLSEGGILKIEKHLGVDNLYEKDFSTLHHLEQGLKARTLFQKDKDYVVKDGEVIIVDEFTGRLMMGRRYSEGLHQAIEAKEQVAIQQESQTLATISFQNYFRMYEKLSGMTGTATTEAEEFHKIYNLDVVEIPTNNPMVRADHPDTIYKTVAGKYTELLKRKGISHALLNAKNHEKEAEIIADAGQKGSVTVATNMAGRGVDILLGKGVDSLGGLFVIGTERHESRRIDNQLRGRSGRQGDNGETRFFVSLEDDLMRIFGGEQVSKVMDFLKMPEDVPIEHGLVSKAIEGAQKKVEGHNFDIRKHTVEYDDVMNQQRKIIYEVRKKILETAADKESNLKDEILQKIESEVKNVVIIHSDEGIDQDKIMEEFVTIVPLDDVSRKNISKQISVISNPEEITKFLFDLSKNFYEEREKQVGDETARQMETFVTLNTIDTLWIEHLDTMDDLRSGIGLRGYAQRDPLIEYKREGFELFEKLMVEIDFEIVHRIFKVAVQGDVSHQHQQIKVEEKHPEIEIGVATEIKEIEKGKQDEGSVTKVTIERGGEVIKQETYGGQGQLTKQHGKIGRNDPCWCNSGKKYKKCHYPN